MYTIMVDRYDTYGTEILFHVATDDQSRSDQIGTIVSYGSK